MKSLDAKKIINKIQRGLIKDGLQVEQIITDLKELRPYAFEEQDPLVHKTIRLTFEHLETNGSFNIPIPQEDEDGNNIATPPEDSDGDEWRIESLDFFLSLLSNSENKMNRVEINAYKLSYLAYAEA